MDDMNNWRVETSGLPGLYDVCNGDGNHVCEDKTKEVAELVAAAPKLLDTCHEALLEICATCVYPDRPYDAEAFPQIENPADRVSFANVITLLRDAIAKYGNAT